MCEHLFQTAEKDWSILLFIVLCGLLFGTCEKNIIDKYKHRINEIFGKTNTAIAPITSSVDPNLCECVKFYLCTNDSRINTAGIGLIDLKFQECEHYLEKCCLVPAITNNPILPNLNKTNGCGIRHPEGIGFRIDGDEHNEAQFGEFPWMAAVLHEKEAGMQPYICGGALIHPQVVVTAGHCVLDEKKKFLVRVGEWDTQTTSEIFPYQDRYAKSITVHPEYYSIGYLNDIAVIILDAPISLDPHIDVLCMPQQGITIPAGTRCYASGWGQDVFAKEGMYQVIMKKVELPVVDGKTCEGKLRTTRLGASFELDESFICAGGELGIDTCKGDGGSPLVCPIPGEPERYQFTGIVSWGVGCGQNQIPGLYTNVPKFRQWIDEQMAINDLNSTSYQYKLSTD